MKPQILFFSRDYQSKLFPLLSSKKYDSIYVVLNNQEKLNVKKNGGKLIYSFEDEFNDLKPAEINSPYLKFSYGCDRFYRGLNLHERELILKKTISFVNKIFDENKISFVVNETVAIEFSEVLAIEAKSKNIKYFSWMSFPIDNRFYWQTSPFHNSIGNDLKNIEPNYETIAMAKEFIKKLSDGFQKPTYIKGKSVRFSIINFLKDILIILLEIKRIIKYPKINKRVFYGLHYDLAFQRIKLFFLSIIYRDIRYDDLESYKGKEMVFYPLHYEPEAVLLYMAYFFDNQINIIENTLKCLPENQLLIVKEHPQQPGSLIQSKFQEIKKKYPNLILIKAEYNSAEILLYCSTIITLGSTAGFEALAIGKKVINLGKVFYDSFSGVNNCNSFEEVYDLLRGRKPFNKSLDFDFFVSKILLHLKEGNPFPHKNLYSKSNIKSIIKAIENEIIQEDRQCS